MALKQISTSQVEMGMFVHSFQGSWLNHPFWKARFLIEDEDRLEAVRQSALDGVVIDTDRGADLPRQDEAPAARGPVLHSALKARNLRMSSPAPQAAAPTPIRAPVPRIAKVGVAREFGNARRVAGQARKVISKVFIEARLGNAPRVAEVTPVVEDIYASIERNPYAFSGLMRCKSEIETIYQHMLSVSALMVSLARQLGLSAQQTHTAGMAGLLLDVGMSRLEIDPTALTGGLGDIDEDLWHRHCYVGRDLLAAAEGVPDEVLQAVARHHEQMDGAGFPQALAGREIDLISRMAAICDRYDLLVSGAATGTAMDPAEAMHVMMGQSAAFDGEILARFQEALGVYPVGSFVRLRSDRIAMVIDQDPSEPALPTVRAFYSLATGKHVKAKVIELANCFGEDAIAGIADLSELGLPSAEELREQLFTVGAK
ncbi:HD-GYP domain-containing protein [Novosphingobium album (ex Hu et al. 2023)]|uniref:DUF3391 domain-containing protein n=1 Tax=Novosphingobium album (ex Hu et al. 2023) TaxID=2930093 RepID=A0ABT0B1R6_9SPHN|nr:HD-GYP domain-containing protein [Novosphingobium album (ex Hu et al. 2023)]MCJ2178960.1 DUF3391 domain-containing protein [Novosphingobium album (ex Hu et al. 2023)]